MCRVFHSFHFCLVLLHSFFPRHFEDRQTEFAVEKVLLNISNSYNFGSFFLFLGSRHHQAFVLVENFFTWRVWRWRRHRLCQCWWGKCIVTQYWEPLWCHHQSTCRWDPGDKARLFQVMSRSALENLRWCRLAGSGPFAGALWMPMGRLDQALRW